MMYRLEHQRTNEDKSYLFKVNDSEITIRIGAFTYSNSPITLYMYGESGEISIGRFCSVAENLSVFAGGMHNLSSVSTYPVESLLEWAPEAAAHGHSTRSKGPIIVGNDVWIGEGAAILSGVTVGDGAVIGARSVVTSNVAPYMIVAGAPARPIRRRLPQDRIDMLLRLRWWDWPFEKIRRHAKAIFVDDATATTQEALDFVNAAYADDKEP